MALINYHFKNFIRTYKWIGPLISFLLLVVILYTYSGQPILSSFASTSMLLLFISVWITVIVLDIDSTKEKQLLFTQLKSKKTYLTSKLIFSFIIILPLGLWAIAYPIITFRFEHMPNLIEILIGIYSHIIIIALGVIMTTLIKSLTNVSDKLIWLFLVLICLILLLRGILVQTFPNLKYILWIFPPVSDFLNTLNKNLTDVFSVSFLLINFWMIGYLIVMLILLYTIFNKSEYIE
ncbi:hypothetical protein E2556_00935 [Staphylococcus croceilyticus]|uniref:ABC transporter permease n=1 Tax=Staphylococcus croceilyticus TaxID=319942 RepID=A0ABY2KKB1_9STAP|nr:hypothetical protein [Staphylococcus croceilyticus]PNZ70690.1 hypothetical protein CD128_01965 [Staphylococcus croceilyticus]TGA80915.1 hypothetical protein E2556_00935 [Staphylococcus croceilyticus]